MKNMLKHIVAFFLALVARGVVHRYKPRVVMVTGSVGKTSTKDAVATVLATRFLVRKSEKSFNSQFGVPFTILGVENPWGNPLAWLSVAKSAIALLVLPNHYPNMLVLEVGADKPRDIAWILKIATPEAVVVTRLPDISVHVEAYASPQEVQEEEFSPAYALGAGAPLIISADDTYAIDNAVRTAARVLTFGLTGGAGVQVTNPTFYEEGGVVKGMQAQVVTGEATETLVVKGSVGVTQLLPAGAALAVASAYDIPFAEALAALATFEPPAGRGRLLAGKNGSVIIDDSYNASPVAVEEALATLKAFPHAKRRIAVIGDMLELGRYSVMEHERIGELARASADLVVAVGIRSRAFTNTKGQGEVLTFDTAQAAATALAEQVQEGDVIMIKGSQSIRTERIVLALLANPADSVLLVRQEKAWKRRV